MAVYRYHGNYCGPGWTAGKYMNAEDATEEDFKVPALGARDQCCKYHDMTLWRAAQEPDPVRRRQMEKQADQVFVNDLSKLNDGPWPEVMAWAVWAMGPGAKLRGTVTDRGSLTNFPPKKQVTRQVNLREMRALPGPDTTGTSLYNLRYGRIAAVGACSGRFAAGFACTASP